jgi:hypothetical protein
MNAQFKEGKHHAKLYKIACPVPNEMFALPTLYPQGRRVISGNLADEAGTDAIAICGCGPTGRRYFDRTNEPLSR